MTLSRRELILLMLSNPGWREDPLGRAQQELPPILEILKLDPLAPGEVQSLLLESQAARTEIMFLTSQALKQHPETFKVTQVPVKGPDSILLLSGTLKHEEVNDLVDQLRHQPGMESVTLIYLEKDEELTIQDLTELVEGMGYKK